MQKGYIALNRKIMEWEWYTDIYTKSVFIHCLLKANHTNKRWRGIEVNRGCFVSSYEVLAMQTGVSVQNVRTSIKKLVKTGELTKCSTPKYTLFKVLKYDEYQTTNKQLTNELTYNQQTTNKQLTTTNNDNNVNNENKYIYRKPVISQTWEDVVEDNPMSEEERQMLIDEIERMNGKDD